jgi:hypothetical protein
MVSITPAMAEMTALMAAPMADTMEPYIAIEMSFEPKKRKQIRTIIMLIEEKLARGSWLLVVLWEAISGWCAFYRLQGGHNWKYDASDSSQQMEHRRSFQHHRGLGSSCVGDVNGASKLERDCWAELRVLLPSITKQRLAPDLGDLEGLPQILSKLNSKS